MSKYLVTGGAGFIGSNIVEALVSRGEEVRVLDNLSTGKEENLEPFLDSIEFLKGDVRSRDDMRSACRGVEYVLHQAALRSVARSVESPEDTNEVNVTGTLNVLLESGRAGVRRVVYASSSSAYGDCEEFPQKETFRPDPISPYAVSKLAAEYYCRMFTHTMGLDTVSLRYFNVFGPRQDPESKYSAVIPAFIDMLIKDEPCAIDGDGTQSRDFTYIANVVDANILASKAPGAAGMVFNVACGEDHSVLEIASKLGDILGKDIAPVHGPRRPGDVMRTFADISSIRKELGYEPVVGFHDGLKETVEWFTRVRA